MRRVEGVRMEAERRESNIRLGSVCHKPCLGKMAYTCVTHSIVCLQLVDLLLVDLHPKVFAYKLDDLGVSEKRGLSLYTAQSAAPT